MGNRFWYSFKLQSPAPIWVGEAGFPDLHQTPYWHPDLRPPPRNANREVTPLAHFFQHSARPLVGLSRPNYRF
jgi:hypothetical protein